MASFSFGGITNELFELDALNLVQRRPQTCVYTLYEIQLLD